MRGVGLLVLALGIAWLVWWAAPDGDPGTGRTVGERTLPDERPDVPPIETEAADVDAVDVFRAVTSDDPSGVTAQRYYARLARDYSGSDAMRAAIVEALARGLHDGDEALVQALLSVIEQVNDRTLLALALDAFAGGWMQPDGAKPSRRHWRICLASVQTFARMLGPAEADQLLERMDRRPDSRPLHLLVAEELLWRRDDRLAPGLERFDARRHGDPWVRALVQLALAGSKRSFDPELFGRLTGGDAPAVELKSAVVRASIVALEPSQAVALLRSASDAQSQWAAINFLDVAQVVQGLRSRADGAPFVAGLFEAALTGLDQVETKRQSEMLGWIAFLASGAGPASQRAAARARLRDYLLRTSAKSGEHDPAARSNLMLAAGADLDTASRFVWANRALNDADYGVLATCLSRFETAIEVDGAFVSGALRDQLVRLLRRVFELPANDATEGCRSGAAAIVKKGAFEEFANVAAGD